jgi:hypothetical protein
MYRLPFVVLYFKSGETIMTGFFKSRPVLTPVTLVLLAATIAASLTVITHSRAAAAASTSPSGERIVGQSVLEPVFNDTNGNVTFVMTPINAPLKANPASWAPFYVPVYPVSASPFVGTLQCTHIPADNCPDHGPLIAGAAASIEPSVYGAAGQRW